VKTLFNLSAVQPALKRGGSVHASRTQSGSIATSLFQPSSICRSYGYCGNWNNQPK
jgi:hypothetical protein